MGSVSQDIVNFPSELCWLRSGMFTEVARLVPPEMWIQACGSVVRAAATATATTRTTARATATATAAQVICYGDHRLLLERYRECQRAPFARVALTNQQV